MVDLIMAFHVSYHSLCIRNHIKTPANKMNREANVNKTHTNMAHTFYNSSTTGNYSKIQFQLNGIKMNYNISDSEINWAFIDMQNLYQAVQKKGWKIKWNTFREYLADQHNVTKAIAFIGYVKKHQGIYNLIQRSGFQIEFREVMIKSDGTIDGGNVDADLASYVMDHKGDYHKAIIVADDGDYQRTVKSLVRQNKLEKIISSHSIERTSNLIKKVALGSIISIESLKHIIEYK